MLTALPPYGTTHSRQVLVESGSEPCISPNAGLVPDIDSITPWLKTDEGMRFEIAPADPTFRDVWQLTLSLDRQYCAVGAFFIIGIERKSEECGDA